MKTKFLKVTVYLYIIQTIIFIFIDFNMFWSIYSSGK